MAAEFPSLLARYRERVNRAGSHEEVRLLLLDFLRSAFGVDLETFRLEVPLGVGAYKGRADTLLGGLVLEVKRDLRREEESARFQLERYLPALREREPDASFVGVATDGLRFRAYAPRPDGALREVGSLDLEREGPERASSWLTDLLSAFQEVREEPTPERVVASLGTKSLTFRTTEVLLSHLLSRLRDDPRLQTRFRLWQRSLAIVYGEETGDEGLFLAHTYLATLARLLAFFALEPTGLLPTGAEVERVLTGVAFEEGGITNFVEEDFFTWFLLEEVREEGLSLARRLLEGLRRFDFSRLTGDVLKDLYQQVIGRESRHALGEFYTPDWLAEYLLREAGLPQNPTLRVLDPACGSGTFLFTAIRLVSGALRERGWTPAQVLDHIQRNIVGIDVHPLAVLTARTTYLLALQDLLRAERGFLSLPIYLADSLRLPRSTLQEPLGGYEEPVYTFQFEEVEGAVFELPESVVANPAHWQHILFRMGGQYLEAVRRGYRERAEGAFLAFLRQGQPRYGLPPLSPFAAEVLLRTFRRWADLDARGKDSVWTFVLRNIPCTQFLHRSRFDLVAGNPPWLAFRSVKRPEYQEFLKHLALEDYRLLPRGETHLFTQMEMAGLFFARCADLYLKEGGTIAFVLPRSVLVARQHEAFRSLSFRGGALRLRLEKVIDLAEVSPLFSVPTCALVARKGEGTDYPVEGMVLSGRLPRHNAPWAEAEGHLRRAPTRFLRHPSGALHAQGTAPPPAPARSPYAEEFFQGATIVPRTFWLVELHLEPGGFARGRLPLRTAPEARREAKAPWDRVEMRGVVEEEFLFATLLAGDLLPFAPARFAPVVLPLVIEGGRYRLLSPEEALERGSLDLSTWLRTATEHWERLAKKGPEGRPRESLLEWLDYRRKLIRQDPEKRYKVLYNASGTHLTASVVDSHALPPYRAAHYSLPFSGFLADAKTYVYETGEEEEAHYLAAVLNAPAVDAALKPLQTRGLFGERDFHKRPLSLPIPRYDPQDGVHRRLAEIGEACARRAQGAVREIVARYRSVARRRGEMRALLREELEEIDRLVRGLLALP